MDGLVIAYWVTRVLEIVLPILGFILAFALSGLAYVTIATLLDKLRAKKRRKKPWT